MENIREEKITVKLLNNFILPISIYLGENNQRIIKVKNSDYYEFYGEINKSKIKICNLIQEEEILLSDSAYVIERKKINYFKLLISILPLALIISIIVQNNSIRLGLFILIALISILDFNNFVIKNSNGEVLVKNSNNKKIRSMWQLFKNRNFTFIFI